MKKDIIQLALFPSIILGLLGFTSSISFLRFISRLMGFRFDFIHVEGVTLYSFGVAALFALCPLIALYLYLRKFKGQTAGQSIVFHIRYLAYLLLGVLLALIIDMAQVKYFRYQLEQLSTDAVNWTSYIEELNPFPYGVAVLLIVAAAVFFTQQPSQKNG